MTKIVTRSLAMHGDKRINVKYDAYKSMKKKYSRSNRVLARRVYSRVQGMRPRVRVRRTPRAPGRRLSAELCIRWILRIHRRHRYNRCRTGHGRCSR